MPGGPVMLLGGPNTPPTTQRRHRAPADGSEEAPGDGAHHGGPGV